MVTIHRHQVLQAADPQALKQFQQGWSTYRKVLEHDYLGHSGAYATLHGLLLNELSRPFSFLDLACGDASASVAALQGTQVRSYRGVDLSRPALELAKQNLASLPCPIELDEQDFTRALDGRAEPIDVVWIGLSLHHLSASGKQAFFATVRAALSEHGYLLIYEPIFLEGENRPAYLERMREIVLVRWNQLSAGEAADIYEHISSSDFPESTADWERMGRQAGFSRVQQLFTESQGLYSLFSFRA